jgi:MFS family permease
LEDRPEPLLQVRLQPGPPRSAAGPYDFPVSGLRLLYLAVGAVTACLNPFIAVILKERGLDPAAIGVVTALGAAGLVGSIAVWGHLGDAVIGRRQTLQLCAVAAALVALGIAFTCTQGALLAIADSIAVNVLGNPRLEYGRIRLLASFSFAIGSIAVGAIYDRTGYGAGSLVYVAITVAVIAGVLLLPATSGEKRRSAEAAMIETPKVETPTLEAATLEAATVETAHRAETAAVPTARPDERFDRADPPDPLHPADPPAGPRPHSRFGSTGVAFSVQPRLFGVLATAAVVWFAVIVSFTYLSLRIVALGGQASDVALSSGVSAFAEIPGMFLAARLAARVGLRGLFAVSAIGYALAFLAWAVLDSPDLIVATRLVTGISYGGLTVTMVLTIGELLPGHLQSTGQALYQGTATGVAAIAGNAVGGLLYSTAGAPFLFVVSAAACVAGSAMALVTLPVRAPAVDVFGGVPVEVPEGVAPPAPLV